MKEIVTNLLISLKSLFISSVLATLGWVVLLTPESIAEPFGFTLIRTNHIVLMGIPARTITGLVTATFTISTIVLLGIQLLQLRNRCQLKAEFLASLNSLSTGERSLLAYCLIKRQQTISLPATHTAANALNAKGIFSIGGGSVLSLPFTVNSLAWSHIRKNPDVIFSGEDPNSPVIKGMIEDIDQLIDGNRF
jgi:hypothetical protein